VAEREALAFYNNFSISNNIGNEDLEHYLPCQGGELFLL
jgi:hypothetical protein